MGGSVRIVRIVLIRTALSANDRCQKSDVRGQRTEFGLRPIGAGLTPRREVGIRNAEVGKSEVGMWIKKLRPIPDIRGKTER